MQSSEILIKVKESALQCKSTEILIKVKDWEYLVLAQERLNRPSLCAWCLTRVFCVIKFCIFNGGVLKQSSAL